MISNSSNSSVKEILSKILVYILFLLFESMIILGVNIELLCVKYIPEFFSAAQGVVIYF